METKTCVKCEEVKSIDNFTKDPSRKDGLHPYCRKCRAVERRNSRNANPEKLREQSRQSYRKHKEKRAVTRQLFLSTENGQRKTKSWKMQGRYGITLDDYNDMRNEQRYCCAICGGHETEVPKGNSKSNERALHVDHCHTTGIIRGLLCTNCNTMLGKVKDDIAVLQKAIDYLTKSATVAQEMRGML